jgi:hypothetical protein
MYGKEEVGVDDQNEGSMHEGNNIRYLRMD